MHMDVIAQLKGTLNVDRLPPQNRLVVRWVTRTCRWWAILSYPVCVCLCLCVLHFPFISLTWKQKHLACCLLVTGRNQANHAKYFWNEAETATVLNKNIQTKCQVLMRKLVHCHCWFCCGLYLTGKIVYGLLWCDVKVWPLWSKKNRAYDHLARRGWGGLTPPIMKVLQTPWETESLVA